jgi:hypothetical protein
MSGAKLKVYGIILWVHRGPSEANGNRQRRCVVASANQRTAARAFGVSLSYLASYGGETGNRTEIDVALASPGQVFWEYRGRLQPLVQA